MLSVIATSLVFVCVVSSKTFGLIIKRKCHLWQEKGDSRAESARVSGQQIGLDKQKNNEN